MALVTLLCLMAGVGKSTAQTPLYDRAYRLPLIGRYAIYKGGEDEFREFRGERRLMREMESAGLSFGGSYIVLKVEKVAVVQQWVVGKASQGWFILNTRDDLPHPVFFDQFDKWHTALAAVGIKG